MAKLQHHHLTEACRMRERGYSWREIGKAFGVTDETVRSAVDPIYAERVRERVRASRARVGRKHHVRKPAVKYSAVHAQKAARLEVKAVRIHHLDDIEIWSRAEDAPRRIWPHGAQSFETIVSLPYVSIQCEVR